MCGGEKIYGKISVVDSVRIVVEGGGITAMGDSIFTADYYKGLVKSIEDCLEEKYKSGRIVKEIILPAMLHDTIISCDEYSCYTAAEAERGFVVFYDNDEEIRDGAFAAMSQSDFNPKGPGRTAVMLHNIQKDKKYQLIPALVIICSRDLYDGDSYWELRRYAEAELEKEGYISEFSGRCKYYLDNYTYNLDKKYLCDENGEYDLDRKRELIEKLVEQPAVLAKYFTEHFMETFENKKVVYYHYDNEYLKAKAQEDAERISRIFSDIFKDV